MNDSLYDENLTENSFFKKLTSFHPNLIRDAIENNWIICVPRLGSFHNESITQDDYRSHILTQNKNQPENHYITLNRNHVTIEDKTITIANNEISSNILFEETFYNNEFSKYKVWCIDRLLNRKYVCENVCNTIQTLRGCIDFLWSESAEKNILEQLNAIINDFSLKQPDLYKNDLGFQYKLIDDLYKECIHVALSDMKISESISSNKFQPNIVTTCVEAYVQHSIYKELINGISAYTGYDDASFNKIVRNNCDIQLSHLNVCVDIYESIPCVKQHLAKINSFTTVLDKINCLRGTISEIGLETRKKLSVDELIPVFVFLILKTCIPNWITNLVFLKRFHQSLGDEANFLITTLEASIEYIKSGNVSYTSETTPKTDIDQFYNLVQNNDYQTIKNVLEHNINTKNDDEIMKLCHPLCSCDRCESILSKIVDNMSPTVHSTDDKGLTPLHIACLYGKPKIVELLLENGADIHRKDYSGATPLHYAAAKGHQNALLLLLHSGADINALDSEKNAPLHFACNNGHETCVKAILYFAEHKTDLLNVNCANISGDTSLHHASKWGYKMIVQILLEYGADPNIENKLRKTSYDYANNFTITQIILQEKHRRNSISNVDINNKNVTVPVKKETGTKSNESGFKPTSLNEKKKVELLLRAVAYGDVPMICYYLGLQIPNGHTKSLCHPLCNCENCQDDIVSNDKQNINVCNYEGYTALHIASLHGQVDIVKLLLENGAKVNVITRKELTPLHLACQTGRLEIVKLLAICGESRINAQDAKGNTPLHYACNARDARIVDILIKNNANARLINEKGMKAFDENEWETFCNVEQRDING